MRTRPSPHPLRTRSCTQLYAAYSSLNTFFAHSCFKSKYKLKNYVTIKIMYFQHWHEFNNNSISIIDITLTKKKKEKTACTQHYCTYQEKKFHKAAINKENIRVLRRSVHLKYIGIGCFMVKPFIQRGLCWEINN